MDKLTFTELYKLNDILAEQIRHKNTDKDRLLKLVNELRLVKKAIYRKQKNVLDQIEKRLENVKGG